MKKRKGRKEAGGVQLVATESADEMNCVPPDFSQINELWLFKGTKEQKKGTKEQKTYKAEFVGVIDLFAGIGGLHPWRVCA